jgi:serine/threonine protein kinase
MIGMDKNHTVKLGDFGLSGQIMVNGAFGLKKVTGVYGTAPFMCPEMLKNAECNEKADIWSLGVVAYVLLFGSFPYLPREPSSNFMKKAIVEGSPPTYEPAGRNSGGAHYRTHNAINFVKPLLNRDALLRPSAADACHMSYVNLSTLPKLEGKELPSLREMLHYAKRVGAFEMRDPSRVLDLDGELAKRQMEKHGRILPEVTEIIQAATIVKANKLSAEAKLIRSALECPSRETSTISTGLDTASSPSPDWTPAQSSISSIACAPGRPSQPWRPLGSGWSNLPSQNSSVVGSSNNFSVAGSGKASL